MLVVGIGIYVLSVHSMESNGKKDKMNYQNIKKISKSISEREATFRNDKTKLCSSLI